MTRGMTREGFMTREVAVGIDRMGDLARLCFSLRRPVDRRTYALVGFALMIAKYSTDALVVRVATGLWWTPSDYLAPRTMAHWEQFAGESEWVFIALVVWTLPFAWVGASMTARRSLDAGFSGLCGLLFFVPVVSYVWMLTLCLFPTASPSRPVAERADGDPALGRVLSASVPATLLGVGVALVSIFWAESYGPILFVATPFAMGFAAAYRARRLGLARTRSVIAAGQLSLVLTAGLFLLFALEGAICLAMAAPLAIAFALAGSLVGGSAAMRPPASTAQALLVFASLPILLGAESLDPKRPLREVVSAIEVDASPETVWRNVIGFPPLPPPSRWPFALGIAYPERARIEGRGVGAVRYCEFSTGAFVEPITRWEEPSRLSFDVADQPEPMQEWSPYEAVNAPHLLNGLHSRRGEFRLTALPGGRTLLEGSTGYTLNMGPAAYWSLWSDALIHQIHARVLEHVKRLSEARAPGPTR